MNSGNMTEKRNWMSYLLDSLVNSGAMPAWEAVDYLTNNLVGEAPNSNLHQAKSPYEAIQQFLHRVYGPIVEAASRTVELPPQAMIHMFTDISLMDKSAVLVVYYPGHNQPHQLLLLDAVRGWDLVFDTSNAFDQWAEERYGWIVSALKTVCQQAHQHSISNATEDLQPA
ncbi:MAG: hypothetical protein AB7P17_01990 [Nitrospirales bacterium]